MNRRVMAFAAFACLLVIATIIGCTSVGEGFLFPGVAGARFAFVVNGNADDTGVPVTISVYRVDSGTGAPTAVAGSPFNMFDSSCCSGDATSFVDVDPNGRFLFVPRTTNGNIGVFSINQDTGVLSEVAGSPFDAGTSDPYVAKTSLDGRFLYVVDYDNDQLFQFTIGSDGALTATGTPLDLDCSPHLILMDPQGRFLYVPNECGEVEGFTINSSTGALTAMGGNPFPTIDYSTGGTVDSTGRFLLVANKYECAPGSITVFNIDQSTGELSEVSGSPFQTTADPFECGPYTVVEAHVAGVTYMAANNFNSEPTIAVFSFNTSTGELTPVSGSPFDFGLQWPHFIAVDPAGNFGYIVDFGIDGFDVGPSTISVFSLQTGGDPVEITGSPFSNGTNAPTQIIIR